MPHALVNKLKSFSDPLHCEGFTYEFITNIDMQSGLIKVSFFENHFFIDFYQKLQGFLLKINKNTRLANIELMKKSILYFIQAQDLIILRHNLNSNKNIQNYKALKTLNIFDTIDFSQNIFLEIGFGSGRHLLYNAEKYSKVLHIGVEIHKTSLEQVLKQIQLRKLNNIIILDNDARSLLASLPPQSLDKIFLHFPVPWNKVKHKRVFNELFLQELKRLLKTNGLFHFRTDSKTYFDDVLAIFLAQKEIQIQVTKNIQLDIESKYESRWRKLDKNIYDIFYHNQAKAMKHSRNKDFSLDIKISLAKFEQRKRNIIKRSWLLIFNKIYYISNKMAVIKIIMGDIKATSYNYLLLRDNRLNYYLKMPTKTNKNYLAHLALKKVLKDIED